MTMSALELGFLAPVIGVLLANIVYELIRLLAPKRQDA